MTQQNIYAYSDATDLNKMAMKSPFMRMMSKYSRDMMAEGRLLTVNAKPLPVNTSGQALTYNNVIDVCSLPPQYNLQGINSLGMEISYFHYSTLPFFVPDWSFTAGNMPYSLFYDYLLVTSVCLVEVFDSKQNGRVKKFFATRNPILACMLIDDTLGEKIEKFENAVAMNKAHYEMGQFNLLKVNFKEKGATVSVPRKSEDFSGFVKVTPLYFLTEALEGFQTKLDSGLYHVKFIKDNLTLRAMDTTTSPHIISKAYPNDYAVKAYNNRTMDLSRGYIRLPEMGLSRFDETGVRAINLTRIIEFTPIADFDKSFIHVDFESIVPKLRDGVNSINNMEVLKQVYFQITGKQPPEMDLYSLRVLLQNHIDLQYTVGTTVAQKGFHRYMLSRPDIFVGYNGIKMETPRIRMDFNLGFEE